MGDALTTDWDIARQDLSGSRRG